jgi:hypothetical protein
MVQTLSNFDNHREFSILWFMMFETIVGWISQAGLKYEISFQAGSHIENWWVSDLIDTWLDICLTSSHVCENLPLRISSLDTFQNVDTWVG